MSPARTNTAPGGVEICDQAWRLLRAEAMHALPLYYIGALPFTLCIAWLWFVTTNDPLALRQLPGIALVTALAFVWMKTWQARYAQVLLARLEDREPPAYGLATFCRSAAAQAGVQSLSWIALPITLLFTVPFAWVYGFFQNATALDDGTTASARVLTRDALRHAHIWPKQNHIIFWLYSPFLIQLNAVYLYAVIPFLEAYTPTVVQMMGYLLATVFIVICIPLCPLGLVTYINISAAIGMIFFLLKTFFAVDTVFTLAPDTLQNSATFMVAILLTGLCMDPLLKAAYVIRCFHSRAQSTGQDIRVQLRGLRAKATATVTAVVLLAIVLLAQPAAAQEGGAAINPDSLDAAIDHALESHRYNWRVPPGQIDEEAMPVVGGLNGTLRDGIQWIQDGLERFTEWLREFFGGEPTDEELAEVARGVAVFTRVLRYLLAALSVALFLVLLAVFYRAWRDRREMLVLDAADAGPAPAPDLEDESTSADQLPEDGWLRMAQDLQARGEHRLAIRALFLATLARLAHLGFIHIARFKSNRDYSQELERRAHVVPEILHTFQDSARVYDAVWYGAHEAGEENVTRLVETGSGFVDTPRRRTPITPLIALAMAFIFVVSMWWIMHERAAGGEGYDYYSSYRSDPLGLSVLHDALAMLPRHAVERNLQDLYRLRNGVDTTLFFAGAVHSPDPASFVETMEGFVVSGGRLIIAFQPLGMSPTQYADYRRMTDTERPDADTSEGDAATGDDSDNGKEDGRSARERWADPGLTWIDDAWGFHYAVGNLGAAEADEPLAAIRVIDDDTLPDAAAWFSTDYFEPKIPAWKTHYEIDGRAVLMERAWGLGSIVVASDTYFLSNEGLAFDPAPRLVAWLFGENPRILIDETIHNVRRETGIMGLLRQYRLTGLLLAFVLVALLYVWQQTSPLVPRHSLAREAEVAHAQSMRDAYAGLVRLLARSVPRKKLIPVAVAQWQRAIHHNARVDAAHLARVQAIAARDNAGEDPVATYREIVQRLKERT